LRLRQRLACFAVASGGVGHAGVQPARVEGVAQVVVRVDVLARPGPGVAAHRVGDVVRQAHQAPAACDSADAVEVEREDGEQGGQVRRVPFAGHVTLGQTYIAGGEDPTHEAVVV